MERLENWLDEMRETMSDFEIACSVAEGEMALPDYLVSEMSRHNTHLIIREKGEEYRVAIRLNW